MAKSEPKPSACIPTPFETEQKRVLAALDAAYGDIAAQHPNPLCAEQHAVRLALEDARQRVMQVVAEIDQRIVELKENK